MGRTLAMLPKTHILRCSRHLQVLCTLYPPPPDPLGAAPTPTDTPGVRKGKEKATGSPEEEEAPICLEEGDPEVWGSHKHQLELKFPNGSTHPVELSGLSTVAMLRERVSGLLELPCESVRLSHAKKPLTSLDKSIMDVVAARALICIEFIVDGNPVNEPWRQPSMKRKADDARRVSLNIHKMPPVHRARKRREMDATPKEPKLHSKKALQTRKEFPQWARAVDTFLELAGMPPPGSIAFSTRTVGPISLAIEPRAAGELVLHSNLEKGI